MNDDHHFQDYTKTGELEFLISEFNQVEITTNDQILSFIFREQNFQISLIRKRSSDGYTSSLGSLSFPEEEPTLLFWRAFNHSCEELVLISPNDASLNISTETAKIIFSAYYCSSLSKFPLVIKRSPSFEFLSINPNSVVLRIFGDWKFSDSINWVQAKIVLTPTKDEISLIQSCTKFQYYIPFKISPFSSISADSISLPIGRYYESPKAQLLLNFLNPAVKSGLFDYEYSPIIPSSLEIEDFPLSVLQMGFNHLSEFIDENAPENSINGITSSSRNLKLAQFSNPSLHLPPDLVQFVLFRENPESFSERFYLALLGIYFAEPNIMSHLSKNDHGLKIMCRLYMEIIKSIEKISSSENLNIFGLLPRPQWSDPLIIQHISSVEFMNDCIKRDMIKSLRATSDLKLLDTDEPIIIPEILEDGTDGITSDRADIYSDSSKEILKDERAVKRLSSDMQAFKASNPNSQLADFIRWHSPRDWNEADNCLSERMSSENNDWQKIWNEAQPCEAKQQSPLFDPRVEIANSFDYLKNIQVSQLIKQLIPHFKKITKKMVNDVLPKNLDSDIEKEQLISLMEALQNINFSKESIKDLVRGKSVLLSQERERDYVIKSRKNFLSQEVFIETKNGSKFFTKNTADGTTMIGQMIKE
jgi:hypothetical protein